MAPGTSRPEYWKCDKCLRRKKGSRGFFSTSFDERGGKKAKNEERIPWMYFGERKGN